MIEINLIPDVKQQYIKAKQARTMVISGAIIVGIVSVGLVVLLAVYLFGVQTLRSTLADNNITKNEKTLKEVPDLDKMLTIQSQLSSLKSLHDQENITSRVFDLLAAINPAAPNQVTFSNVKFDATNGIVHVDGQASNGFVAADALKKTIQATKFNYKDGKETSDALVAKDVIISNLSYGEDATGKKVLRFSIDLTYDPQLFLASTEGVAINRLGQQNATDSHKYLPESLFGDRASDVGGNR